LITQIYEIQTPGEAAVMVERGVDHVGSVVCSIENWQEPLVRDTLREAERKGAKSSLILLFSEEKAVCSALSYYRPDIVHFCDDLYSRQGGEIEGERLEKLFELQRKLRSLFPGMRIMRSVQVPSEGALESLPVLDWMRAFEPVSDYFLIDTWMGGDASQPVWGFVGITGVPCNWRIAAEVVVESRIPVILAGGLSPENVYEAVRAVRPAGVDSCTRTNAVDSTGRPIRFRKDADRVARFVNEAHRAEKDMDHKRHRYLGEDHHV
jgi:phosphoribosylanthranilate isomerase